MVACKNPDVAVRSYVLFPRNRPFLVRLSGEVQIQVLPSANRKPTPNPNPTLRLFCISSDPTLPRRAPNTSLRPSPSYPSCVEAMP